MEPKGIREQRPSASTRPSRLTGPRTGLSLPRRAFVGPCRWARSTGAIGSSSSTRFGTFLGRNRDSLLCPMGLDFLTPWHIAIFALVVLLCFGPKRLPEIGRSAGRGIREFKNGIGHQIDKHLEEPASLPPASSAGAVPPDHDAI